MNNRAQVRELQFFFFSENSRTTVFQFTNEILSSGAGEHFFDFQKNLKKLKKFFFSTPIFFQPTTKLDRVLELSEIEK